MTTQTEALKIARQVLINTRECDAVNHAIECIDKALAQQSNEQVEPCPDKERNEYACKNRQQCWEPCGELGKSEEHAKVYEQVEPVAWRAWFDADNSAKWLFTLWPEEEHPSFDWQPLYTHPPVPTAQPEQGHPQAWLVYAKGSRRYFTLTFDIEKVPEIYKGGEAVPLCTTPPQRKPLTEGEFLKIVEKDYKLCGECFYACQIKDALAKSSDKQFEPVSWVWKLKTLIEAAHGIKE